MEIQANLEKSYLALTEFLLLSKKNIANIGEKFNISPIQAITLVLLNEPRPMNSFTKIFNCDASNTTGIIDGLEHKELVGRYESPNDRRVKMIALKPKGKKIRKVIIDKLTGDESFIVKKLSYEEIITFINLLKKITS
jgi:DNA-binding MarR family transcriptional regulator